MKMEFYDTLKRKSIWKDPEKITMVVTFNRPGNENRMHIEFYDSTKPGTKRKRLADKRISESENMQLINRNLAQVKGFIERFSGGTCESFNLEVEYNIEDFEALLKTTPIDFVNNGGKYGC